MPHPQDNESTSSQGNQLDIRTPTIKPNIEYKSYRVMSLIPTPFADAAVALAAPCTPSNPCQMKAVMCCSSSEAIWVQNV